MGRTSTTMKYREFVERVANCTGNEACCGPEKWPFSSKGKVYTPNGLHRQTNPHWKPQIYSSNLFKFLPAFNFIGSFEHLAEHTKMLLESTGLWDEYGANGWGRLKNQAIYETNGVIHATLATDKIRAKHTDPELERRIRRAYWADYAVLERIGLFVRDKSSLADHLLERQRHGDDEDAASAGLLDGADHDGHILGGPFGGAHGDGVNRHQGSYATAPAPRVPPTFRSQENPVLGEHWADADFFAGFGPMYGP